MRLAHDRSLHRGGFTLIEMLLVVALLALLAGLTLPAMHTPLRKSELRDAAKMLRAELTRARLRAIETGVAQRFRFRPGGPNFEVAPRSTSEAGTRLAFPGQPTRRFDANADESIADAPSTFALQAGVIFLDQKTAAEDLAEFELPGLSDMKPGDMETWSKPIVFYPNGRTGNARIRLRGQLGFYVDVTLRGAIGSATIGKLMRSQPIDPVDQP